CNRRVVASSPIFGTEHRQLGYDTRPRGVMRTRESAVGADRPVRGCLRLFKTVERLHRPREDLFEDRVVLLEALAVVRAGRRGNGLAVGDNVEEWGHVDILLLPEVEVGVLRGDHARNGSTVNPEIRVALFASEPAEHLLDSILI